MAKDPKDKRTPRAAKPGYALLAAPEGVTGAGAGEDSYQVGDDGLIEVRAEHVADLLPHGFQVVE